MKQNQKTAIRTPEPLTSAAEVSSQLCATRSLIFVNGKKGLNEFQSIYIYYYSSKLFSNNRIPTIKSNFLHHVESKPHFFLINGIKNFVWKNFGRIWIFSNLSFFRETLEFHFKAPILFFLSKDFFSTLSRSIHFFRLHIFCCCNVFKSMKHPSIK